MGMPPELLHCHNLIAVWVSSIMLHVLTKIRHYKWKSEKGRRWLLGSWAMSVGWLE